jgi:predicted CoA-substrate-specific enzyme activase
MATRTIEESDNSHPVLYAGIDVGSSFTKIILINQNKEICGHFTGYSGIDLRSAAKSGMNKALPKKASLDNVNRIVTSGYGRRNVEIPNVPSSIVTEISCAAKAAHHYFPNQAMTIVDIGGQDTKIIKTSNGKRDSFRLNRKCAAGTGAWLEEIALKLRVVPTDLNGLAIKSTNPERISSFCTVFGGTEILTRIREGAKVEDMVRGAYYSIVKRVMEIDTLENEIILVGGVVAHHPVIVEIFEEKIGKPITVPKQPQAFVALGAALYALEKIGEYQTAESLSTDMGA